MDEKTKALIALLEAKNSDTVFGALGIYALAYEPEVILAIDIDKRHLQHGGLVHGGVYVVLAESAASIAAALKVGIAEYDVSGMEINANHVRRANNGRVTATSKLLHQGKSHMVYSIEVMNCDNELLSIARCTIAVKKRAQV